MPRTEAQKRAEKKYHEKTYKPFTINAKLDEYAMIENYCNNNNNISKNKFMISAAMYIIKNNIKID